MLILNLDLDTEKLIGWKGGKFGIDFLRFDGEPQTNGPAACRDTILCPARRHCIGRNFINYGGGRSSSIGKLIVRIGKTVPTADFNNVLRPVPTQDQSLFIPSVVRSDFHARF